MKEEYMTKTDNLTKALLNGEELTAKQIKSRFGFSSVDSVRKTVSDLRNRRGMAIYLNQRVDTKGRVKTKYRLGTPSARVVAAGYRALGA